MGLFVTAYLKQRKQVYVVLLSCFFSKRRTGSGRGGIEAQMFRVLEIKPETDLVWSRPAQARWLQQRGKLRGGEKKTQKIYG